VSIPNRFKKVAKTLFVIVVQMTVLIIYCKGATLSGCFVLTMPTGVSSMEVKIGKVAIL
jgi:LEA14-like dessication related protein